MTLRLTNQCFIPLPWCIEMSTNLLRVIDGPQMLEPHLESLVLIERRPSPPGKFIKKLYLEVFHFFPLISDVCIFI
jgi:hypothetical protein